MMTLENLQTQIQMTKDDIASCLRRLRDTTKSIEEYGAKGVKETENAMADQPWYTGWISTLECRVEDASKLHAELRKLIETLHLLQRIAK